MGATSLIWSTFGVADPAPEEPYMGHIYVNMRVYEDVRGMPWLLPWSTHAVRCEGRRRRDKNAKECQEGHGEVTQGGRVQIGCGRGFPGGSVMGGGSMSTKVWRHGGASHWWGISLVGSVPCPGTGGTRRCRAAAADAEGTATAPTPPPAGRRHPLCPRRNSATRCVFF